MISEIPEISSGSLKAADYANAIEEMSVPAKFNQQLIREKAFSFFDLDTGVERYQKVYEEVMK